MGISKKNLDRAQSIRQTRVVLKSDNPSPCCLFAAQPLRGDLEWSRQPWRHFHAIGNEESLMSVSRRQFLSQLSAAGMLATAPRAVRAAEPALLYPPIDLAPFGAPVSRGEPDLRIGC